MASMFCSPAELSDSDGTPEDFERDATEVTEGQISENGSTANSHGRSTFLTGHENYPHEEIEEDMGIERAEIPDVDAEGHSAIMTTALLEFYCLSRAADILNQESGSHGKYNRDSREVKILGRRLYSQNSQFLSSHGVVAGGIDGEDWSRTRQYYRDSLDTVSLIALEGLDINNKQSRPSSRGTLKDSRALPGIEGSEEPPNQTERLNIDGLGARRSRLGLQRRITDGATTLAHTKKASKNIVPFIPSRNLHVPFASSAPQIQPRQTNLTVSRYSTEFEEEAIIGKGSYGAVFRAKHRVDGQVYAIKKVPLSPKRLQRLQEGGLQELDHILKEIRTLARLEHANVVRYYGAWAEFTDFPKSTAVITNPPASTSGEAASSQLQTSRVSSMNDDLSFGVVFENPSNEVLFENSTKSDNLVEAESCSTTSRESRSDAHKANHSACSRKNLTHNSGDHVAGAHREKNNDDEVESVPRRFDYPSYNQTSTAGTTEDIFSDGRSGTKSQVQLSHKDNDMQGPVLTLHIQMSLHPISLARYLSPQSPDTSASCPRHCFHVSSAIKILLDILSGVEYLHATGVVHRDLKPGNIFLSRDPVCDIVCPTCQITGETKHIHVPRIGDFGLVANISRFGQNPELSSSHIKSSVRPVGTEFYRPPLYNSLELSLNSPTTVSSGTSKEFSTPNDHGQSWFPESAPPTTAPVDESLDIYALGVILFELLYKFSTRMERQMVLSGLTCTSHGNNKQFRRSTMYPEPNFPDDFARIVDQAGITPKDGDIPVSTHLTHCIRGMLEPDARRRWTCKDVRTCLENVLSMEIGPS